MTETLLRDPGHRQHKKHDGSLPLIGVHTFLGGKESQVEDGEIERMRSTEGEKVQQVENVGVYRSAHDDEAVFRAKIY